MSNYATLSDSLDDGASTPEALRAMNDNARALAFSDPSESMKLAERVYELASAQSDHENSGKAMLTIGVCHFILSDFSTAHTVWSKALDFYRAHGLRRGEAQALNNIGNCYSRTGNLLKALDSYSAALDIYRLLGDIRAGVLVMVNIGMIFKTLGDFPRALEYYRQAVDDLTILGDFQGQAHAFNNIGNVYLDLGDHSQALDYFTRSLTLAREYKDVRTEAQTLNNIGNIQERLGKFAAALGYYEQSLQLKKEIGDRHAEGNTLGNIGIIYQRLGELDVAMEYLEKSLATFQETGDRDAEANALLNIGVVYHRKGELDKAADILGRTINMARDIGNLEGESAAMHTLGQVRLETNQWAEAETLMSKALVTAEELQAKALISMLCQSLSQLYRTTGRYEAALNYYERFHQVDKELFDTESDRRIQTLMVELQIERTEKEREMYRGRAELLERDIEFKRRELASHTLNLVERNKLLTTVRRSLERLADAVSAENRTTIKDILNSMRSSDPTTEWEIFSDKFQELHGEFAQTLAKMYPDLSPAELKICALTKVHLSTKEIAAILHTSIRTVEAHRYRLRKKLDIPSEVSLTSFLNSLPT